MVSDKKVLFYEDEYYMFSNFSAHSVEIHGKRYPTSEHAYQALKFDHKTIQENIRNAKSAWEAKRISRQHENDKRNDWQKIKVSIMEHILREKALQHEDVMQALLNSGDSFIGENSPVDFFWGVGANGTGENWIGKIWMGLRDEFRK